MTSSSVQGSTEKSVPCAQYSRPTQYVEVTKELSEAIGRDYRVLPIFEKGLQEYRQKKYYSLYSNELLKCRWTEYNHNFANRVIAPFQFLDIRDYHFYNCQNQLVPSISFHRKKQFRFKLKPGPGVDTEYDSQLPIPQELLMCSRGEKKPTISTMKQKKKRQENKSN